MVFERSVEDVDGVDTFQLAPFQSVRSSAPDLSQSYNVEQPAHRYMTVRTADSEYREAATRTVFTIRPRPESSRGLS